MPTTSLATTKTRRSLDSTRYISASTGTKSGMWIDARLEAELWIRSGMIYLWPWFLLLLSPSRRILDWRVFR